MNNSNGSPLHNSCDQPEGLSAWGHERVGYDSATKHSTHTCTLNNKIKSRKKKSQTENTVKNNSHNNNTN